MDGASRGSGTLTPRAGSTPAGGADERAAWRAGRRDLREALGPLVRALVEGETRDALVVLREKPGRRRLARGRLASGEDCFFKHYPPPRSGQRLRGAWKRALGLAPSAREFAALRRLHATGVAVPEPLALYRFPDGGAVLVTRWIEGEPLRRALARGIPERRALIAAVGTLVARLHASRTCHRDLHAENVWVTADGPMLIDLPAAVPASPRWLRRRDLGDLDMSVASWLSLADRIRLRAAGLGATRPFSRADRAEMRAVGRASEARRRAYLRSRTSRSLRPGRLYTKLSRSGGRGMRLRRLDEPALREALDSERGTGALWVERFGRERLWRHTWRRASPAKRAWLAGHGLRAREVAAPRPWAFVEWRRFGRVERSAVVLEGPRETRPGDFGGIDAWLRALVELATALRRDGVDHEALATDPLCRGDHGQLGVTRLEAIRLRRRLDAEACARIDAFVRDRVEASGASQAERDDALARYAARTAFLAGPVFRTGPAARITRSRS